MREGGTAGGAPLIGVEDLETPYYLKSHEEAARAGVWAIARQTPRTAAVLVGWAWRASRGLTAAAGAVQLLAAVTAAFGLLATTEVFARLLEGGPTPDRLVAALPALAVVVAAAAAKGLLDSAAGALEAELAPRIEQRAEDELHSGLVRVDLIAFEDPDFAELVRRNAQQAIMRISMGVSLVGNLIGAVVNLLATAVAAGVLHPLLVVLVLLAGLPRAWASVRSAQAQLAHIVQLSSDVRRRGVTGRLISERGPAAEVRAFTAQDLLLGEHRRIGEVVTAQAVRLGRRQNTLRSMSARDGERRRITVLVTHRLANVRHADQIVVLDGGRVVESGTHATHPTDAADRLHGG